MTSRKLRPTSPNDFLEKQIACAMLLIFSGLACTSEPTHRTDGAASSSAVGSATSASATAASVAGVDPESVVQAKRNQTTAQESPPRLDGVQNSAESSDARRVKAKPSAKDTEWKLISEEDGIQTYVSTVSQNGIISFRGVATLPVSIEKLATVLNSFSLRKEWVDSVSESRIVEGENTLERIEYSRAKVPWPFQDRDFLFQARATIGQDPRSMRIEMNSIVDPRVPERAGIVRGEILHSFYALKEVPFANPAATEITVEIAADPKGAIPTWIVNLTQKKWPHHTLTSLYQAAKKPGLAVAKEVANAFSK